MLKRVISPKNSGIAIDDFVRIVSINFDFPGSDKFQIAHSQIHPQLLTITEFQSLMAFEVYRSHKRLGTASPK